MSELPICSRFVGERGEGDPLGRGGKRRAPPLQRRYSAAIGLSGVKMLADRHRHAKSSFSENYNLRNKISNRQLPNLRSHLTGCNFYVRELAQLAIARISYGNSVCLSVCLSVTIQYRFKTR